MASCNQNSKCFVFECAMPKDIPSIQIVNSSHPRAREILDSIFEKNNNKNYHEDESKIWTQYAQTDLSKEEYHEIHKYVSDESKIILLSARKPGGGQHQDPSFLNEMSTPKHRNPFMSFLTSTTTFACKLAARISCKQGENDILEDRRIEHKQSENDRLEDKLSLYRPTEPEAHYLSFLASANKSSDVCIDSEQGNNENKPIVSPALVTFPQELTPPPKPKRRHMLTQQDSGSSLSEIDNECDCQGSRISCGQSEINKAETNKEKLNGFLSDAKETGCSSLYQYQSKYGESNASIRDLLHAKRNGDTDYFTQENHHKQTEFIQENNSFQVEAADTRDIRDSRDIRDRRDTGIKKDEQRRTKQRMQQEEQLLQLQTKKK